MNEEKINKIIDCISNEDGFCSSLEKAIVCIRTIFKDYKEESLKIIINNLSNNSSEIIMIENKEVESYKLINIFNEQGIFLRITYDIESGKGKLAYEIINEDYIPTEQEIKQQQELLAETLNSINKINELKVLPKDCTETLAVIKKGYN